MGPMQYLNVSMDVLDSLTSRKCKRQHMPMEFFRFSLFKQESVIRVTITFVKIGVNVKNSFGTLLVYLID